MKKRLLFLFAAALCAGGVSADLYEVGDFVYTPNGRFQITGENLLTNGDFSDGFNGWINMGGESLSTDTFEITTDGPDGDGDYCLTTLAGDYHSSNLGTTANFHQIAELEANNTYICSYKVRAYTTPRFSCTSTYSRNTNLQAFHLNTSPVFPTNNTDYDNYPLDDVFSFSTIDADWTEQNMDYSADSDIYCIVYFCNLIVNDSYADFGIYEAKQVGDDRRAQDLIDMIDFFLNIEELNVDADATTMLTEARTDLESVIGTDISVADLEDMLDAVEGEGGPLDSYLDVNSADLSGYFENLTFDDCEEASSTVPDGWSAATDPGNWGVEGDEMHGFTTPFAYSEGRADNELEGNTLYQTAALPAGKYLYVVRAYGMKYYCDGSGVTNDFYMPDYHSDVDSVLYYVNEDTVICDVDPQYANVYMNVFEVDDYGKQTIGYSYPSIAAHYYDYEGGGYSGGGYIGFDNIYLRIIGMTTDEVETYIFQAEFEAAQEDLQAVIDSAETVLDNDKYIFESDILEDSVASAKNILSTLTDATDATIAYLSAETGYLEAAISRYYTINAEYVTLGEDINTCEAYYADENREDGKQDFFSAISVAKTYYEEQTSDSRDSAELVRQDEVLMDACDTYLLANASQTAPFEYELVNNSFQTGDDTGWVQDGETGNAKWKFNTSISDFTDGACVYYNRGYKATDDKYIYQDVEVSMSGVYLYTAEVICNNSSWSSTSGYDTETYIYLNGDSVMVITEGLGESTQLYPGDVTQFYVISEIEDINSFQFDTNEVGVLRLGLARIYEEQSLGLIYLGSNHLYYLGPIADFDESTFDIDIVGIKDVVADASDLGDVYTLTGVKVRSNTSSLKGLEKGVYIKNGKKYVVK